ncbi:SAC3 domain-containing protein 1-like [Vespa mandarinia]|uniref:SAC3 domain-containing protein 1-like n=1 Tax=Vespa mandarinia TaxID=7446 RepID=UPI001610E8C0|nr:SAC3 domain-containing protein 1-like [Vespa mandarinia]
MTMSETINGICLLMCPEKERWMREKEGLLHRFEIDEKTKHLKKPKADPNKIIKSFSRPAAGQIMTDPSLLRPGPVLLSTIKYLFTKILTRTDVDWVHIYDFTFDRLRAIRQDLVIQRIGTIMSIQLLEPIVRFHTYAAQRLCERNISEFDPKINDQHLLECIKQLLILYDTVNKTEKLELHEDIEVLTLIDNRAEMEALYILLNIGDISALNRALSLPEKLRKLEEIRLATNISIAWYLRNYVRVFRLIQKLRPILVCAAMCNLKNMRRNVLQIMSSGYNNKILTFPGLKLQELILYKDIEKLENDCKLFNLTFTNQNILFQKTSFNDKILLANSEMYYTPQILHKFLPNILLGSL